MIIHKEKLTHGGIDQSIVDTRILFSIALDHLATAIVVAHNHPSGNLKPSRQDIQITESLKNGGELLNIKLLDHLIISQDSFFSFSDEGIL
jgi:DNA repair protein RadC